VKIFICKTENIIHRREGERYTNSRKATENYIKAPKKASHLNS